MSISNLADNVYIDVNDAFSRVTGYSKQTCIGKSSTQIGLLDNAAKQRLANLLIKHRRLEGEVLDIRKQDGTRLVCEYWGEIISIGDQLRLVSIAHDITARKRAEWEGEASEKLLRLINQQKKSEAADSGNGRYAPALVRLPGTGHPAEGRKWSFSRCRAWIYR